MSGFSRAWKAPSAFLRHSSRIRRRPVPEPTFQSFVRPTRTDTRRFLASQSSKKSANNIPWAIGDQVLVDVRKDQSQLLPGVIEEIRKAGWYSIRLEGQEELQKVRKSQLQQAKGASEEQSQTLQATKNTKEETEPALLEVDSTIASSLDNLPIEEPVQAMPTLTLEVEEPAKYPVDPQAPPPPPRMDNLDLLLQETPNMSDATHNATHLEYLQQLQHHSSVRHWVVFTDLHCAPSTLDTCLEVLAKVHRLAQDRQAGVLFLGDFWHHRGTLRVDCLNAVLQELRDWTVPMIMIPGNHDQVTLGGHSHGLTPLERAYRVGTKTPGQSVPGPLVFSHPTLFAGALWAPHVRDITTLEAILASDLATQQAQAIFVHADVTGAYMNDLIVSTGGVHPSAFPPHKPIYSGHFHKPHNVTHKASGVAIEYMGSPFEISLAEAQQAKALVVLDATQQWKCTERIPLSIGRKHYKPRSVEELLALGLQHDSKKDKPTLVKDGDRVVVTLPRHDFVELDDKVEDHIRQLRKGGVAVEVREDKDSSTAAAIGDAAASTAAPAVEDMSPASVWERFWEDQVQGGAVTTEAAAKLQEAGMALLEAIDDDNEQSTGSSFLTAAATNLQFESVSVEGYGPFANKAEYPLNDRGLVLLRGSNLDGGSDSNGSGKTSLAMATLWALTGTVDPRPVQDSKVTDVVNDANKNAKVTVTGHVNGMPFSITRTKTPKKSGLAFILGGEDLTTQSVKETMVVVEEKLGVSAPILARTMFHGQHALNELLEATDVKLKEELSLVVPLELWQAAAKLARSKARDASKKESELAGMASMRADDLETCKERCSRAAADVSAKEHAVQAKEAELEDYKKQQLAESKIQVVDEATLEGLRQKIKEAEAQAEAAQTEYRSLAQERESDLQVISRKLSEKMMAAKDASQNHQQLQLDHQSSTYQVQTIESEIAGLESLWQVDLSSGTLPVDFNIPETCPTCAQPIPKSNGSSSAHDHNNLQARTEVEIKESLHALAAAKEMEASWSQKLDAAKRVQEDESSKVLAVEEELQTRTEYWRGRVADSEKELATFQKLAADMTKDLAASAELHQQATLAESSLEAEVSSARQALGFAKEAHDGLEAELASMTAQMEQLRAKIKDHKGENRLMSSLSDGFGARGVQTFVLLHAVRELQSLTQNYLNDFSDGAQRLELSLDTGDNKISRQALVREPDGSFRERPLATLSGGQWRRCSLALTLGFADLVATRGGLRPSLIVLDEPLTHLDRAGRRDVGKVLRKILGRADTGHGYSNFRVSTIIVILQDLAAEELEEAFDRIDEVVKQDGGSSVKVDDDESS